MVTAVLSQFIIINNSLVGLVSKTNLAEGFYLAKNETRSKRN